MVSRIEASSTPLILVNPRAVSKEAPVCRAYTQGAPNGTAGIRGISRFLRRGARRCRDDDRSIDRSINWSNGRTSRKLPNYAARKRAARLGKKKPRGGLAQCKSEMQHLRQHRDLCILAYAHFAVTRRVQAFNALFILRRVSYIFQCASTLQ